MNLSVTSVNPVLDIVVASKSKTKVRAVEAAFAKYKVNVLETEARSGISSQPVDNETFDGPATELRMQEKGTCQQAIMLTFRW